MNNNKVFLNALLVLAIILLGILLYGVYAIRAENQNISQIANLADEASNESAVAGSIRSIKNSYSKEIKTIDTLLIHGEDLIPFIDSIEKIGHDMNLNIETTTVLEDKTGEEVAKYPLTVHITEETDGSWGNSMRFLHALENLPTNVSIENVSLVSSGVLSDLNKTTKSTEKNWHLNVTFSIYTFK